MESWRGAIINIFFFKFNVERMKSEHILADISYSKLRKISATSLQYGQIPRVAMELTLSYARPAADG